VTITCYVKYFPISMFSYKMEAVCASETLVPTYESTRRYNPEDQHQYLHRRENLKSHLNLKFMVMA
jgi:hypothetical protein